MSGAVTWMVCLLAAGYALKWADGQILSAVLPQIQAEFRISDGTLGLLSGLPFAIFYTVLGVPIARLADTGHRRSLVAASLGLFSGFTAVAAAATSVPALFAARIGVGLGEAGATPPAQSLIADVVPAGRRGFALAIYGAGLNFGILAGFAVGGIVGGQFGWRAAFLVCGLPGLLVAVLTRLTIDEPGRFMTPAAPLRDVFAILARRPGFAHVLAANSLAGLAGFAALAWLPTFLGRTHGMALRDADLFLGVMSGIVGLAGVLLTGWLADLAGSRLSTMLAGLCLVTFPSLAAFYLVPGPALHAWLFILPALFGAAFAAPSAAIIHSIASPGTHATALSLLLFVVNLVGTACGPILTGFFSDLIGLRAALALTTLALPWAAWHFSRVRLAG